jgi:methyltransferase (TIGR00027 family)
MALFRALENFRPSNVRLFEDRFALEFLTPSLRTVAQMSRYPYFNFLIPWLIDRRWPGTRSSGIARTRFIDDALLKAFQEGLQQVVILGAGFDCRAYRISGIDRTRVYEVGHPNKLAAKRRHLIRVLGSLPRHALFAEIDFNRQQLEDILAVSGFDPACPSGFIWEGVTNYLMKPAVDATLQFIRAFLRTPMSLKERET